MPITNPVMNQFDVVASPDAATMSPATVGTTATMTPAQMAGAAQMNVSTVDQGSIAQPVATTAEDRIQGILSRGGPLMQQAATAGKQQAASRGLLNSSMAIGAAQGAVINAAGQIGTADANAINQMAATNAGAVNSANQFNSNALNQGAQFNASNQQQTSQFNATNEQQASQANQQATNATNQFNANTQNQAGQFNATATNDFAKLNTQNQNTANQWNAQQQNEAVTKTLDINSREQLANIEANYKQLMQVNSSAEAMYSQVMKNISDIQNNKDIADKETAINSQMSWLNSGMQMIQNLNGVTGLVTFGTPTTTPATP